jgi:YbgC/YbaW family acyl-CoA thioester hydrolase
MTATVASQPTIDYGHVEVLPVHFDDLDPMGVVHNARYAVLIERALATFWRRHGHTFRDGRPTTPDAFNVVKEFSISYRAAIHGPGDVVVHFWLERMGRSCAVYNFCLLSPHGTTVFAEGRRVVIKLDPETLRPSPWTPEACAVAEGLLRRPGHAQSRPQASAAGSQPMDQFDVVVGTGSFRSDDAHAIQFPHRWTSEGVTVEAAFSGAHLLHLATAGCVLNDIYREAGTLGIQIDGVRVSATGGFDTEAWTSTGITYSVELSSPASAQDLARLVDHVDDIAEIPRAIRAGATVRRANVTPRRASS